MHRTTPLADCKLTLHAGVQVHRQWHALWSCLVHVVP